MTLLERVRGLEHALDAEAKVVLASERPGDMCATHADTGRAGTLPDYAPMTALTTGLEQIVDWLHGESGRGVEPVASLPLVGDVGREVG